MLCSIFAMLYAQFHNNTASFWPFRKVQIPPQHLLKKKTTRQCPVKKNGMESSILQLQAQLQLQIIQSILFSFILK